MHNEELIKIGVGTKDFKKLKNHTGKRLKRTSFDLNYFVTNRDQYVIYSGQSTNGECNHSLVILNMNSFWVSHNQMKEFGEQDLPYYVAKDRDTLEGQKLFQNFIPPLLDSVYEPIFQQKFVDHRLNFSVPFVYESIMYAPKIAKKPLGKIPDNAIPYWKGVPDANCILRVNSLPEVKDPYKLQLYYYDELPLSQTDFKEPYTLLQKKILSGYFKTDKYYMKCDKIYNPQYIVVDEYFFPQYNVQPLKIPIAIRSRLNYPNKNRPVMHIRMPVIYNSKDDLLERTGHIEHSEEGMFDNNVDDKDHMFANAHKKTHHNHQQTVFDDGIQKLKGKVQIKQCRKWKLNLLLNLNFNDDDVFENLSHSHKGRECIDNWHNKNEETYDINTTDIGNWGGSCTCADGNVYQVGNIIGTGCKELACVNG